ncbi:recombinase RecT, partial [[Eubacterium] siraeum]|nr:recombinase RecT [[Eubacterium] siraeum]
GALLGESLNLSPSPQLGQFYLVPFKQKAKYDRDRNLISPECVNAQFVLGYKGYIQLAVRSGMYRKIIVQEIKDGELIGWNPRTEEFDALIIDNEEKRDKTDTIG